MLVWAIWDEAHREALFCHTVSPPVAHNRLLFRRRDVTLQLRRLLPETNAAAISPPRRRLWTEMASTCTARNRRWPALDSQISTSTCKRRWQWGSLGLGSMEPSSRATMTSSSLAAWGAPATLPIAHHEPKLWAGEGHTTTGHTKFSWKGAK